MGLWVHGDDMTGVERTANSESDLGFSLGSDVYWGGPF